MFEKGSNYQGEENENLANGVDGTVLRPFFLSNLEMAITRINTSTASDRESKSIIVKAFKSVKPGEYHAILMDRSGCNQSNQKRKLKLL